MDKNTERQIAKGLQQGDNRAWLQLYEAYAEPVWKNIARLMGGDSAAVSDVVQETFLSAARSARNFDPERASLWAWLWTIAPVGYAHQMCPEPANRRISNFTISQIQYVDSRPADRIAEQMGCSSVAVRSKLARVRKAFQKDFRKIIHSAPGAQEVLL